MKTLLILFIGIVTTLTALAAADDIIGDPVPIAKPLIQAAERKTSPSQNEPDYENKEKYETKVLWDFNGCVSDRFMQRVYPTVYNGNVYLFILLPEFKTMIVKVPLDGGKVQMEPLMPGHVTGNDPHRYYAIDADSLGYIHVTGDMHSSPFVNHWISKKPEDISEFVFAAGLGSNKGPQGRIVTYPRFFRSPDGVLYHEIRCADPVWGIGISVLDIKSQTWTMLGADVAGSSRKGKWKVKGNPMSAWEDNGEGGLYNYTQPQAAIRWGTDKRMHLGFGLLNENTPSSKGGHTLTHALYAYSDDGGKTIHRADGSKIEWPIRAEAGPHQGDVVYSEPEGPPPWLNGMMGLGISVLSKKTGKHSLVLEKGKWTELRGASSPASDPTTKEEDQDEEEGQDKEGESEKINVLKHPVGDKNHHFDHKFFHETGNLVHTVLPKNARFKRIMVLLSKPINPSGK
jgi:hypothetical protein